MNDGQLQTVEQVRQFLEGSEGVELRGRNNIAPVVARNSLLCFYSQRPLGEAAADKERLNIFGQFCQVPENAALTTLTILSLAEGFRN